MKERQISPSTGIYPATEDYIHALELRDVARHLYVSGTMGLDQYGKAPEGLEEQLELIWGNIARILQEADMTMDNIVRITSYLTKPEFAESNQNARLRALGERRVPTTAIIAGTLDPSWLVEVEVIAAA